MVQNRTVTRLLIVSVLVNLFLIGGIGGHLVTRPTPPEGLPDPFNLIEKMVSTLPEADARIAREVFSKEKNMLEAKWKMAHHSPDAFNQALRTDPFDKEAAFKAWQETGLNGNQARDAFGRVLIESAARMSKEGRQRMSEFEPPKPKR